jgi:hypothetical protein
MLEEKKQARRMIAKESDRIKRAREKLLARWDDEARFMNGEAIDEIKEKIKNQYHRNTSLRTRLSDEGKKPLRLFAQGEGVQVSAGPRVKTIMERVRKEMEHQKIVLDQNCSPIASEA